MGRDTGDAFEGTLEEAEAIFDAEFMKYRFDFEFARKLIPVLKQNNYGASVCYSRECRRVDVLVKLDNDRGTTIGISIIKSTITVTNLSDTKSDYVKSDYEEITRPLDDDFANNVLEMIRGLESRLNNLTRLAISHWP